MNDTVLKELAAKWKRDAVPPEVVDGSLEAYAAGRIAGLEEAAAECLAMRTISGMDDVERGFNAAIRKASEAIRNLKETK